MDIIVAASEAGEKGRRNLRSEKTRKKISFFFLLLTNNPCMTRIELRMGGKIPSPTAPTLISHPSLSFLRKRANCVHPFLCGNKGAFCRSSFSILIAGAAEGRDNKVGGGRFRRKEGSPPPPLPPLS